MERSGTREPVQYFLWVSGFPDIDEHFSVCTRYRLLDLREGPGPGLLTRYDISISGILLDRAMDEERIPGEIVEIDMFVIFPRDICLKYLSLPPAG